MQKLQERLSKAQAEVEKAKQAIVNARARKRIRCASCKDSHAINQLDAIQTHWYTSPHGCMGGDYWNAGEIHFICPNTGVRNRILFHGNIDVERKFRSMYGRLFKHVEKEYEDGQGYSFVNNYLDPERFDLGHT